MIRLSAELKDSFLICLHSWTGGNCTDGSQHDSVQDIMNNVDYPVKTLPVEVYLLDMK